MVTFISHIGGLLELNDLRLCTNMKTPLTQNQRMYDHCRCHAFYKRSPCDRIVVHVTLSMTPLMSRNLKCIARLRKGIVYVKCRKLQSSVSYAASSYEWDRKFQKISPVFLILHEKL